MKSKNILKKTVIKESYFSKSIKLAKSSPNKIALMVLFDILFITSAFSLNKLLQFFSQSIFSTEPLWSMIIFVALSLLYYLLMLLVYSFFKYLILDYTKSLFEKSAFSFSRLGQFYGLNVAIAGIFFATMLLFNYILNYIQASYRPIIFIIVAVPYLLLLYVMLNASHSLFYIGSSIKDSLKKGIKIMFKNSLTIFITCIVLYSIIFSATLSPVIFSNGSFILLILIVVLSSIVYRYQKFWFLKFWTLTKEDVCKETIFIDAVLASYCLLFFYSIGLLISLIGSKNYGIYLSTYSFYKQATIIVFDIVLYLVILINRIIFYFIMNEEKQNRKI